MCRSLPLFFLVFYLSLSLHAQSPSANLDKPTPDVDDALRARITKFYDLHVQRKYRQAEQLVAEESKDDFYVLSKTDLKSFKIGNIEYSDNFTKAKVVIIGNMPIALPMFGGKEMDIPFASYWKIDNGLWCWYYNKVAARHTPFGDVKAPPEEAAGEKPHSDALPTSPAISVESLQHAVKIERTSIDLQGNAPQSVKVLNTLNGSVKLTLVSPAKPFAQTGLDVKLDRMILQGNEAAILTVTAGNKAVSGDFPLRINVSPTNQVLDLTIHVAPR
jgi:hypothetical protein